MVDRNRVPAHLHERYGIRPQRNRLRVALGVVALAVGGYIFVTINQHVNQSGDTRLISWNNTSATSTEVTFTVSRPSDTRLICVLRAQDSDRFDVGYARVRIDYPSQNPRLTVTLATRSEAFTVTEPQCDSPDSAALIGSHFRPGLLPPAQTQPLFAPWQDITSSAD